MKPPRSIALDLGTTRIKAGSLAESGQLEAVISAPAPPLSGDGAIREGDAQAYVEATSQLLSKLIATLPRGIPLGIATQRSSFLLWDRRSGEPATPLISWQDCRAADWCDRHAGFDSEVARRTGLRLSPHYAGPKLAFLMESDPGLRDGSRDGRLLFGTLESYLLWKWTGGAAHETDLTVAPRTLLADIVSGAWSDELLDLFGVPRACLAAIRPTAGRKIALESGPTLCATIADQASGALACLQSGEDAVLVNLGTGGFVVRVIGASPDLLSGYLCAPILGDAIGGKLYSLEGSINGAAAAADRFGRSPKELPVEDPSPLAFCLPDTAGVGSPHWLPRKPFTLSPEALKLEVQKARRVVLEGIVFRVREIVEGICRGAVPERILLSGGLARDPFVGEGLASCLGRTIDRLEEFEATLLGAARLAAGLAPYARPEIATVHPGRRGAYLASKYARWKSWLEEVLASSS